LSYPLNYWNGLAVLTALGIPFLLRVAVAAKPALVRGAAVAPIPAFTAVIYLASSRGGAVAAAVAMDGVHGDRRRALARCRRGALRSRRFVARGPRIARPPDLERWTVHDT